MAEEHVLKLSMDILQKLIPDCVAFLHTSGQSSTALMLMLTILLHPPPTLAHVEMIPVATAVMLQ